MARTIARSRASPKARGQSTQWSAPSVSAEDEDAPCGGDELDGDHRLPHSRAGLALSRGWRTRAGMTRKP